MPLYVIRWRIGPIPTTLLENLILVTIALYFVTLVRERGPRPHRTWLDIPIALFLVAGLIGIFIAPDHRGALGIYRAYLLEPVAMFYIGIAILGMVDAIELLLAALAVGAVVFSVIEIATFGYAVVSHTVDPGHTVAAFGINPNSVAIYLEPLIALAAGFALFGSGLHRRAAIATFAILLPAELATLSRGGLLALAALAFIGILTVRSPRLRIGLAAAAVLGAFAVVKLPIIGPRVAHAIDPISGTFDNRGRIWTASLRMLHNHPIFGAGINAYQTVMAPYRLVDSNLVPEPYPHNIFLTTWTETGLLGLAAFSWILGALILMPWRRLSNAQGIYVPVLWGVGAAFVMILVHGLVDSPYWKNDLSLEFWLLAALEMVALRALAQPVQTTSATRRMVPSSAR